MQQHCPIEGDQRRVHARIAEAKRGHRKSQQPRLHAMKHWLPMTTGRRKPQCGIVREPNSHCCLGLQQKSVK